MVLYLWCVQLSESCVREADRKCEQRALTIIFLQENTSPTLEYVSRSKPLGSVKVGKTFRSCKLAAFVGSDIESIAYIAQSKAFQQLEIP